MARKLKLKTVPEKIGAGKPVAAPQPPISPDQIAIIDAPIFNASMANIQGTGTEILMTWARARPAHMRDGSNLNLAQGEPVCIISMSPGTLKDLSIMVQDVIATHEKQFGEVKTPFTIKRAAGQAKTRSKRVH